ncbi:hypothetical protein DIPPA_25938 [Diplonema papillatum]|nr:hypothetical protein DIPPA_25938 [Diplonema papillatum]
MEVQRAASDPVKPAGRVVEVPRLDAVCAAAREGDVEGAWMALSAMCEQYLLDRSGMPACERRAHTGRGNSELKMTRVAARSTPDRGVACETELRHGNAIRRLEHYVYQRARLERVRTIPGAPKNSACAGCAVSRVIRGGAGRRAAPLRPAEAQRSPAFTCTTYDCAVRDSTRLRRGCGRGSNKRGS